jgi:integrase
MSPRQLPKYLTQDELKRFFAAITSPRDRALFGLIYHYGLRVDEATAITIQDLALKNLRIRRLKNGVGGEKPLWRHTAKPLRAYMRVRKDAGAYLFTGRGIEYVADHLGHKNIQNTKIYAQITNPLREQVFRELEQHPKIVRLS